MHKFIHRFLAATLGFVMFAVNIYITRMLDVPMFVGFLIGIPVIFIPMALFLKVPMGCDQKGCDGTARLEMNPHFAGKWFQHFLVSGHRCDTCNHFIRLPRRRSSTDW